MRLILNKIVWIYDVKIQLVISSWAFIEVLQNTKFASNFFVMHLSSFFGAIVFLYFINYLKKNKWLKILPIFIEIAHSIYFQGVVDVEDILFSISGIMFYYFMFLKK